MDYATTVAHTAMDQATGRGGKLQPEDLLFLVRKACGCPGKRHPSLALGCPKPACCRGVAGQGYQGWAGCMMQDPRKFARATELLRMNEEIKQAKKVCKCWHGACRV